MTPKLTAENAVIKTATVEVKTLTISGKQVTLAVFRQLPEETIINWVDGHPVGLRGIPWGRVNYHPDKCAPGDDDPEHFHIVWQGCNTLYRARIDYWYMSQIERDVSYTAFNRADGEQIMKEYGQVRTQLYELDQLYIAV